MRAFQYLSIFDLFVRYKTDKANVVFNALFRFSGNFVTITKDDSGILKALYEQVLKTIKNDFSFKKEKLFSEELSVIYHVTLVKMFDDFKSRFLFKYIKNKQ